MKYGIYFLFILLFGFGFSQQTESRHFDSAANPYGEANSQTINHIGSGGAPQEIMTVDEEDILMIPNMNSYTTLPQQKQIVTHPGLNTVVYANRQDPATYMGGINGHFRYSVSTDGGQNWTKGIGVTNADAAGLGLGRHPEAVLFTNVVNPSVNDLKLHLAGPIVDVSGVGFAGQIYNSVTSNLTSPNNYIVTQEDYVNQGNDLFYSECTHQGINSGIFWKVDVSKNSSDNNFYLHKGFYNPAIQKLQWTMHDTLEANWNIIPGGSAAKTAPNICFSPDGTKGYVICLGDLAGGAGGIYQPIVWEYDYATDSWMPPYEVSVNICPDLTNYFIQTTNSLTNGMYSTGYYSDLTVDANGKPHILVVLAAATAGLNQNAFGYGIVNSGGYQLADFTINSNNIWEMINIGTILPFTISSGVSTTDFAPHLSRTEDGYYLFYTWLEGTTPFSTNADLVGAMYDIQNDMISPSVNRTFNDPLFSGNVNQPKTAENVLEDNSPSSCGRLFIVPTVSTLLSPGTNNLLPQSINYFKDILFDCADAALPVNRCYNCNLNPVQVALNTTPPTACNTNNGSIQWSVSGGVPGLTGYAVSVTDISGNTLPISGNTCPNLANGSYNVWVADSMGCVSQSSVNFPSLGVMATVLSTTNPHCFNTQDGSANIGISGGVPPYNILWSSGNTTTNPTNLISGTNTYTITDANQCITTGTVVLSTPPIVVTEGTANLLCHGDNTGSINIIVTNGATGTVTYSWSPPSGNTNILAGVPAGIYYYTLTDSMGCSVSDSVMITEPPAILINAVTVNPNTIVSGTGPWSGSCSLNVSGGGGGFTYSWSLVSSGFSVPLPNNPGVIPTQLNIPGGDMTIIIEDSTACKDTVIVVIPGPAVTSITDIQPAFKSLSLSPNPAHDYLQITFSLHHPEILGFRLVDLNGKIIKEVRPEQRLEGSIKIETSTISQGIYLLQAFTSAGTISQKIEIQR